VEEIWTEPVTKCGVDQTSWWVLNQHGLHLKIHCINFPVCTQVSLRCRNIAILAIAIACCRTLSSASLKLMTLLYWVLLYLVYFSAVCVITNTVLHYENLTPTCLLVDTHVMSSCVWHACQFFTLVAYAEVHCVPKKHVTTFLMISWSNTVRLQRFLAHLLLRV